MVIDAKRLTVEEFDEWIHLPENADKRVGGGSRKKNCCAASSTDVNFDPFFAHSLTKLRRKAP